MKNESQALGKMYLIGLENLNPTHWLKLHAKLSASPEGALRLSHFYSSQKCSFKKENYFYYL